MAGGHGIDGRMRDCIVIRGLSLTGRIGVPDEERAEPQTLRAHLTMEVEQFPIDDEIDGTVDYKAVSDQVVALAGEGERKLIETLAQEIAGLGSMIAGLKKDAATAATTVDNLTKDAGAKAKTIEDQGSMIEDLKAKLAKALADATSNN